VKPEINKSKVLQVGINQKWSPLIEIGGQTPPTHIDGERLKWENAQKKEKKNITSETIKRIIPNFKPRTTFLV
jgi:hypothetical protein